MKRPIGVAVGGLVLLEERRERRHVAFVQSVHGLGARVVRLCRVVMVSLVSSPLTTAVERTAGVVP